MIQIIEKDEKEAIKHKHCPVCREKKFCRSIIGTQRFQFDEAGKVFWRDRIEYEEIDPEIDVVFCVNCKDRIPKRIWREWFK